MILQANPFVRLWEAPVETLTLTGYVFFLLAFLAITLAATYNNAITIVSQFRAQYPHQWRYDPPAMWVLRIAAIPFVLGVDFLIVSAVVRFLT